MNLPKKNRAYVYDDERKAYIKDNSALGFSAQKQLANYLDNAIIMHDLSIVDRVCKFLRGE